MLSILIGIIIGLTLGLTGGGGAILAVPLLIFAIDMPISLAVPVSLLITASAAFVGTIDAARQKLIYYKPLAIYGLATLISTPFGLHIGENIDAKIRIIAFSILMLIIALHIIQSIFKSNKQYVIHENEESTTSLPLCRFADSSLPFQFISFCSIFLFCGGLATGLLSGFFGVGGGFLIVPALMFLSQMDIKHAIGNSLAIISIMGISVIFSSYNLLADSVSLWGVILLASAVGMLIGRKINKSINMQSLKIIFSLTLLIIATFTLYKTI